MWVFEVESELFLRHRFRAARTPAADHEQQRPASKRECINARFRNGLKESRAIGAKFKTALVNAIATARSYLEQIGTAGTGEESPGCIFDAALAESHG